MEHEHEDVTAESLGLEPRSPSPHEVKGIEAGGRYRIEYTNWRGERGQRDVRVLSFGFGSNQYHPEPDLMVIAVDEAKDAVRTFALAGIHAVSEAA